MADEEWQIVNGPEGPLRFPKSMSRDEMAAAIEYRYNPQRVNVEGKPGGILDDVMHSIVQGGRNAGEHLIGLPGQIDDLERAGIDWLKRQRPGSPLQQTGEFLQAGRDKMLAPQGQAELLNGVPAPNWDDMSWLTTQATGQEPYQPQTTAGNVAMYGTEYAIPGAVGLKGVIAGGKGLYNFGKWAKDNLWKIALPGAGVAHGAKQVRDTLRDEQGTSSDHYR